MSGRRSSYTHSFEARSQPSQHSSFAIQFVPISQNWEKTGNLKTLMIPIEICPFELLSCVPTFFMAVDC